MVSGSNPIDVAFVDCHQLGAATWTASAFVRLMRTATDSPNPFMPIDDALGLF